MDDTLTQKIVLITGAGGFIGRALSLGLGASHKVIGLDLCPDPSVPGIVWKQADINDKASVDMICREYAPDAVIHCAGIAHQKAGSVDRDTYMRVNAEATANLAMIAAQYNPRVRFIFLSSISVYGEKHAVGPVAEDAPCSPSSDYACSKLYAEERLISLFNGGMMKDLVILRLAPVYDRTWSLNLDRRVLAPFKMAYLRFGSGEQKMSALARPNLVDFIMHVLKTVFAKGPDNSRTWRIFNVCDDAAYGFNTIIEVFNASGLRPHRPVIFIPLAALRCVVTIGGVVLPDRQKWLNACYEKLSTDLVFDTGRMAATGFKPRYSLKTLFARTKQ